jgi:hypothetical protein
MSEFDCSFYHVELEFYKKIYKMRNWNALLMFSMLWNQVIAIQRLHEIILCVLEPFVHSHNIITTKFA